MEETPRPDASDPARITRRDLVQTNMMFLYPDLVDMSALGNGPLAPDMKPPDGIGGLDPRQHASPEVGRRNIELASQAIGRRARELLASLPEDQRSFKLPAVSPEHWWMI